MKKVCNVQEEKRKPEEYQKRKTVGILRRTEEVN